MSQSKFLQYLKQLYKEQRELTILEVTYLIIAVLSFLVAAVIALLNQSLGVALLIIPFLLFSSICQYDCLGTCSYAPRRIY